MNLREELRRKGGRALHAAGEYAKGFAEGSGLTRPPREKMAPREAGKDLGAKTAKWLATRKKKARTRRGDSDPFWGGMKQHGKRGGGKPKRINIWEL